MIGMSVEENNNLILRLLAAMRDACIITVVQLALITALPQWALAQNIISLPAVWVAGHKTLQRIDSDTNQISQIVTMDHDTNALAVDSADGGIWALTQNQLSKFDNNGRLINRIDLKSRTRELDNPRLFVLNSYDSSLWVAAEHVLLHLDAQGQLLQTWEASDDIKAISLDIDESLWILSHRELLHLSAQNIVLQRLDLKPLLKEPEYLALDSLGKLLWIGSKQDVIQLDLNHLDQAPRYISLPDDTNKEDDDNKVVALDADTGSGDLWLVTKQNHLFIYGRDGNSTKYIDIEAYDLSEEAHLAFDPASASFWLSRKNAVDRFNRNGDFIARIILDDDVDALGVTPFHLAPTLSLLDPADDGLTNNPRPPIRLGLGSRCNTVPCNLPDSYTQSLSLDVNLNGQAVGPYFSQTGNEALYSPTTRLPEGPNVLSAQAIDQFGHSTERISSYFAIDTIPPNFLRISPDDGSIASASAVTIQGILDDATANTTLLDSSGQVLSLASGANFSFIVDISPGLNVFRLIARDPAGNETTSVLHLTYSTFTVNLVNPLPNATLDSTALDVSGTFQGSPNTGITINGVVAMTYGNQFYANLDLEPGENTLTITATAPDGATITKTITVTVTVSAPDPIAIAVEPQSGVAPLPVQFTVTNNTDLGIAKIEADFDGNGTTDFNNTDPSVPVTHNYPNPGFYSAALRVTDSQGIVHAKTFYVVVNDAVKMDTLFKSIWDGMNQALIRGDNNTALTYLNEGAKRKYGPVFQALLPHMPAIIASFSSLQRSRISEDIGEYAVNNMRDGRNWVFFVYFLKDNDGVWRLDTM